MTISTRAARLIRDGLATGYAHPVMGGIYAPLIPSPLWERAYKHGRARRLRDTIPGWVRAVGQALAEEDWGTVQRQPPALEPGDPPYILAGKHPAQRIVDHQAIGLDTYLHGDPRPTHNQIAAVLHALADHTHYAHMLSPEVLGLGRRPDEPSSAFSEASGLGRYFHRLGDALETFDEIPARLPAHTAQPDPKG